MKLGGVLFPLNQVHLANRGLGVHLWVSSTCNTAKYCFLCASRAFPNFCQFLAEKGEFSPKIDKILHQMTSFCWNFAPKKVPSVLDPTPKDPLLSTKSYTGCPLFSFSGRHIPITFIFECPGACSIFK